MSGVFGGDSGYSPIHTPSPMHGNPLTPGAGLGPLSPAYTPQTPMGQYDDGKLFLFLFLNLGYLDRTTKHQLKLQVMSSFRVV